MLNSNSQSILDDKLSLNFDSQTLLNNLSPGNEFAQTIFDTLHHFPEPEHLRNLPILEDMETDYKFDMNMNSESGNKSSWLYSGQLNKIFVKLDTPLNVYPVFIRQDPNTHLYIRAMVVFTSPNDLPEPVKKCPNHKEKCQPGDQAVDHILKCDNSGSIYEGNENGKVFADKLSVLIPMSNIASNEPLKLIFTCQNSCSGGMNRKSTSLIFTLEDQYRNILGRKTMNFKVCSCPRRDKEKDEQGSKALPKKRKHDGSNAPSTSKKVHLLQKQDSTETLVMMEPTPVVNIKQELDIPCELKINLPNEQLKKEVLNAAYNVIAGEMARSGNTALNFYLTDIQKQIGK